MIYIKAETPFEWHQELLEYSRAKDITIFSTPFDETAVDLLQKLNTPVYKVASFELTDLPLLTYISKTKNQFYYLQGCHLKMKFLLL